MLVGIAVGALFLSNESAVQYGAMKLQFPLTIICLVTNPIVSHSQMHLFLEYNCSSSQVTSLLLVVDSSFSLVFSW
jgi:hypothetical protein